ncbi:MAG: outer membrane protein assembly factor BamD [Acidobacteriota bacterium]|jgi:outer membrane protein assembly factor BamD|nr:outer membrane protein assembly factor BamD [Acidobacteriota bacterium]
MRFRKVVLTVLCAALMAGAMPAGALRVSAAAQDTQLTPMQRLDVMRSRLETMRRTLNSAIAGLNSKDKGQEATADDPRVRLGGLEKEANKLLNEVADLRGKQERAERFDVSQLDKLEAALAELDTRVQASMRDTMRERSAAPAAAKDDDKKKKGPGFIGRILGRGDEKKYDELVGTVAPGRDRELFEEATKEARHESFETSRSLFSVIINTYPDSVYLPLAKLAIADTFYLEGTTSALIQAGQAYQDWVTFFPTHSLSDDVCLKMGEVEMRRMGLANRDISPARKAEHRLKFCLQQFPKSALRPDYEVRLSEIQESLADHERDVGDQYFNKFYQHRANNLKGAQARYRVVVENYKNYSGMAAVLYRFATTYLEEEEPDEATKYLQQLVRRHPNSEYAEKAKEKLAAIGAQVPDPDPDRLNYEEPKGPGMVGGVLREISGVIPKTVVKDGVIISQSSKGGDIIADVIANGGTLPANYDRPTQRTAPARDVRPLPNPAPAPKKDDGKKAISLEPTRPGAPATGSDPTRPAATQPTTPATPPPGNGVKP